MREPAAPSNGVVGPEAGRSSPSVRLAPYGPYARLLTLTPAAELTQGHGVRPQFTTLMAEPLPGLREVVPGIASVLLDLVRPCNDSEILGWWQAAESSEKIPGGPDFNSIRRDVEIPVDYSGPDLARVARHARCSIEEIVARHWAANYQVQCLGFAPGFPYLDGLDPRLHTPRLATPRLRVRPGSVAIGGAHAGIYSIPSPGGWNVIGYTSVRLFDPTANSLEQMFRLNPGDRLRFVPLAKPPSLSPLEPGPALSTEVEPVYEGRSRLVLRIHHPGVGLTIQDLGRPGYLRFGVPAGGAMEPAAAMVANSLLGNSPGAPVLELCLGGQILAACDSTWLAIAGAGTPRGLIGTAFRLRAGESWRAPSVSGTGVWTYLAVPGGFSAGMVLGSASTNLRAGLGRVLRAGHALATASGGVDCWPSAVVRRSIPVVATPRARAPIKVWPGPQWGDFAAMTQERFFESRWKVSNQSDRVGYRLEGPILIPPPGELTSEPMLPGTIQIPPDGQPIVTMADGPTLGGYPKLGYLEPNELARLAQTQPGEVVQFVATSSV